MTSLDWWLHRLSGLEFTDFLFSETSKNWGGKVNIKLTFLKEKCPKVTSIHPIFKIEKVADSAEQKPSRSVWIQDYDKICSGKN